MATVAASPKILQLELQREMFSAKYDLSGPIKWIQSTDEVRQRTSSHLATIVSAPCCRKIAGFHVPVDSNHEILLTSHIDFLFIFGQCGDNGR